MAFTRARLYFSDISQKQCRLAASYAIDELPKLGIAGATIYETKGVWNGETEYGFVLETLQAHSTNSLRVAFEELAELLRSEFNQTSVLVTVEVVDGDAIFVEETNA